MDAALRSRKPRGAACAEDADCPHPAGLRVPGLQDQARAQETSSSRGQAPKRSVLRQAVRVSPGEVDRRFRTRWGRGRSGRCLWTPERRPRSSIRWCGVGGVLQARPRPQALPPSGWVGPWKSRGFKPGPGNLAVRDCRGASGNVAGVGPCTRPAIECAGTVTPRPKAARPISIPMGLTASESP